MRRDRSAGVVIFRRADDAVVFLLLRYPAGHWDFAKGRIEKRETAKDAAVRETKEETGISDLAFVDGFVEGIRYTFRSTGEDIHKRVSFFLAETQTSRVRLSDEHEDYCWLEYGDARSRLTYPNARRVISKANRTIASLSR